MSHQNRTTLVFAQHLQVKHKAPAQAGTQVLAQRQILGRQQTRGQHPWLAQWAWGRRAHKPVEGRMLLYRAVSIDIVHQQHVPVGVECGRFGKAGVHPTHLMALRSDGLCHSTQQMAFATSLLTP